MTSASTNPRHSLATSITIAITMGLSSRARKAIAASAPAHDAAESFSGRARTWSRHEARASSKPNELVVAATNTETANPLFHGEVSALNAYWELATRPDPKDCLFLSTHEPCSMCLSAITWSGFDNFFYLFTYEDSRDAFNIPHDLRIMGEVFGLPNGEYNRTNAFWSAASLTESVLALPSVQRSESERRIEELKRSYGELSDRYQASKGSATIPLA